MAVRLPDEVVKRLSTEGIPGTATAISLSEGRDMPLATRGCQELAARMRAEREVLQEAAKLEEARGQAATVEDLRAEVKGLEETLRTERDQSDQRERELRDENARLRQQLAQATAARALAVSGEGTPQ